LHKWSIRIYIWLRGAHLGLGSAHLGLAVDPRSLIPSDKNDWPPDGVISKRLCHSLLHTCSKHRQIETIERIIVWQIRAFILRRLSKLCVYGCEAVGPTEKATDGLN
jgi:hypothetical protein